MNIIHRGFAALLLFLLSTGALLASDLILEAANPTQEVPEGGWFSVDYVLANEGAVRVSDYRVTLYASLDDTLDDSDLVLDTFESTAGINPGLFQTGGFGLQLCLARGTAWFMIVIVDEVVPPDPDLDDNIAITNVPVPIVEPDEDSQPCDEIIGGAPSLFNPGINDAWFNPETAGQ
ncbi:MAG: hypothetical protein AAGH19_12710, partial [Pseudomonadota bacterium]